MDRRTGYIMENVLNVAAILQRNSGEWKFADGKSEGVTEQLKSDNWLLWLHKMNRNRSRAVA